MKALFILSLFLSVSFCVLSQEEDVPFLPVEENVAYDVAKPIEKKVNFELETGVSFGTFGKQRSFSSSYIIPKARFNVSPDFTVSVGAFLSENKWLNAPRLNGDFTATNSYTGRSTGMGIIVAEGEYNILPRLSLHGQYLSNTSNNSDFRNAYSNISSMMSVGFNYYITPNISIGANVNYTEYNASPFYYHGAGNSPHMFGW